MIETPRIVQTEPLHYAALRQMIPSQEIGEIMGKGIAEVLGVLKAQGRKPNGPWFTHHFQRPVDTFDMEICFPVDEPIEPQGRIAPAIWPAMKVARTVYHGHYAGLPHAWPELDQWMKTEGHTGGSQFWERYLISPNDNPDPKEWRTELNWPLA